MKKIFTAAIIASMALGGLIIGSLAPVQASAGADGYSEWLVAVSKAAAADPRYNRIPLDTDAQTKAFMELTHRLYRKQISADQYRAEVNSQYPGHDYEIGFIISRLP